MPQELKVEDFNVMEKIELLTNAEINLKKKSLEEEYKNIKLKILSLTERMKELDVEYDKYNKEYLKRTGKWKA